MKNRIFWLSIALICGVSMLVQTYNLGYSTAQQRAAQEWISHQREQGEKIDKALRRLQKIDQLEKRAEK